jgi:hypothetical protein
MKTSTESIDKNEVTSAVIPVEKQQFIEIGKKQYSLTGEGCVDLTGIRMPKISLSDLPENIIYELCADYFIIKFNPEEKPNIDFISGSDQSTPPSLITFKAQGEIFRQSIRIARKKYPSIRHASSHATDFELIVGFSAHVEGKTIQEVFNSAKIIAAEVLKPIDDTFQIVDQRIKELKKRSKK